MRKISFLAKLNKEGKLRLVEPSEIVKDSYVSKSESNLVSAKILLDNAKLEEAVSLAYYSMYHMLGALLFMTGMKSENHAASIILLKAVFGVDNTDISFAKEERIDKQYYADFQIAAKDVTNAIKTAEKFNEKLLDFISNLNNQKIEEYRKKFEGLV